MPLFGPELSRTRPRPAVVGLLIAALALLAALAPVARAQEVPVAPADTGSAPPVEQPVDTGAATDPPPVPVDPAPPPEPAPQPEPPPAEQPADPPPPPAVDQQPAGDRQSESVSRDSSSHSNSPSPTSQPVTPSVSAPSAPLPAPLAAAETQVTAAPLGWDVFDDALYAETVDGDETTAILAGGGPPALGGLGVLGPISRSIAREKHRDAAAGSRPNATPAGGSGPGGGGPGPGPSMGMFGGGGSAGAGIALLTLLGLACGWALLAPRDRRAFRTSTATWRPSAYVPPIEHPG